MTNSNPKRNHQGAQMPRIRAAGKADYIVHAEMIQRTVEQRERLIGTPEYNRWLERLDASLEEQKRKNQARMDFHKHEKKLRKMAQARARAQVQFDDDTNDWAMWEHAPSD